MYLNQSFTKTSIVLSLSLLLNGLTASLAIAESADSKNSATTQLKNIIGSEQNPPAAQQSETWRKKAPTLPPPRSFKLPEIISYKLNNGLTVELVEDHKVPFITVGLGIKAGSALEPKEMLGLSGLTADMLSEGTKTKTSKEIADEVDFIGGGISEASDYDNSLISGSSLSKYSDRLMNVLSDIVIHPSFPEDELKLKKANLIQELAIKRSEPDFLLEERFAKETFGDHPYSITAPTKEMVEKISRQDLQNFHNSHYLPNDAYLIVVGDFDINKMKELIAARFEKNWKAGNMPIVEQPALPIQHGRRIYLVDRPGSVQSSIKLGNISINKTDPDYFPMVLANQILGGAGSARLFLNIREQKGYTYGAYSSVGARRQPGAFAAEADVRSEVTAPAMQEFFYELYKIRNLKVTDKELADAKSFLAGSFQLGLESQAGLLQRLLEQKLYDLPDNYLETYVSRVLAVTPDQIRTVARKHIDADNIVICVVGDANKIKPELEYFAAVDVYDTAGKPINQSKAEASPGS